MNITILTGGSRGDVQPYVALGAGLRAAGHAVQLISTVDFRDLIVDAGLDFVAAGTDTDVAAKHALAALAERGNIIEMLGATGRGATQFARTTAAVTVAAAQGSHRLIAGLGNQFTAAAIGQKLGIAVQQAYLVPLTPTRAFPSVLAPVPPLPLPGVANYLSHRAAGQMIWQMFRDADTIVRREVLDLPPPPFFGPQHTTHASEREILYGFSPHVVPPPADWGTEVHVCGYWFLEPARDWQPPAALVDFLEAGPPPVYVGFGSMVNRKPVEMAELVLAALARTGQRGVLYRGWGGLSAADLPHNVYMTDAVPHTWLFPRMAAVVHHGGAGTTAAGLRAGVPSILVPFFGDQPFWGARVAALGVGPQPIARPRLTRENLADAIQRAVTDPHVRTRAAALGAQIRAEDGIARAITAIVR